MGVKGWRQYLEREGWLPRRYDDDGADKSVDLWAWEVIGQTECTIPNGSHLHVDGLSLCFHLHRVAYTRHTKTLPKSVVGTFRAIHLLPSFLPLTILHDVAKEFTDALVHTCGMQLVVYMDGRKRYERFKERTEDSRQEHRENELSAYQQFCATGRMPLYQHYADYEASFPKSQLFIAQILHTLRHTGNARVVFCDSEADRIVVEEAASGTSSSSFVLATDSDFCFYADCNYIPLDTLAVMGNTVSGAVLRRRILAEKLLGIPDDLMVELALLRGNDYVDPDHLVDPPLKRSIEGIAQFLQEKGSGFRATSLSPAENHGFEFVRNLYNLKPLEAYELLDPGDHENGPLVANERLTVAATCGVGAVYEIVMRCLELACDAQTDGITRIHIKAFSQLRDKTQSALQSSSWRPYWNDVMATRLIERTISKFVRQNLDSFAVRLHSPCFVFDSFLFHSIVQDLRKRDTKVTSKKAKPPKAVPQVRQTLPVDQHKEEIIRSVNENRVTVIQGGTGCGKPR